MTMEHRALGDSPLNTSVVGLGGNNFTRAGTATVDRAGADAVVSAAIDAGVTFIDTADIYGAGYGASEQLLGEVLAGRRDTVLIATKFGHVEFPSPLESTGPRGSRAYIRAAVVGSLERLATDRIDLYQQHTPDPSVPLEETVGALEELVQEGKIRAWGHSNYSASLMREAQQTVERLGATAPASAQNEWSLLSRGLETEELPAIEQLGLGLLPFFPLANGLLTGRFRRDEVPADSRIARQKPQLAEEADWDAIERFRAFAEARELTMLEATFGWLLSHGAVSSVIAGATRPEQVQANAAAGNRWRPSPDDLAEIDGIFARA